MRNDLFLLALFITQADALAFADKIKGKFGVHSPWVALKKADVN